MKRTLCFAIIFVVIFCSGCRDKNPFKNYSIDISEFSSSELSIIKEIESELTYTPSQEVITNQAFLVHFTDTVKRGCKAEISVKAKPNTYYSIKVTYSSGVSKSKSLFAQNSDNNGFVSWCWTVGAKTKVGEYPVEIFDKDNIIIKTTLMVTDK